MRTTFTLDSTIEAFNAAAQQSFRDNLARLLSGVSASDITLTISAGSINVVAQIRVASESSASVVAQAISATPVAGSPQRSACPWSPSLLHSRRSKPLRLLAAAATSTAALAIAVAAALPTAELLPAVAAVAAAATATVASATVAAAATATVASATVSAGVAASATAESATAAAGVAAATATVASATVAATVDAATAVAAAADSRSARTFAAAITADATGLTATSDLRLNSERDPRQRDYYRPKLLQLLRLPIL